jgi:hypothetical protein
MMKKMKLPRRTLGWPRMLGRMRLCMVIGSIALTMSGCATQPLNQHESNERPGARDASVCRFDLDETPATEEPGNDELFSYEATRAVGLTGLMGGVYAEALGVRQVLAGQLEAKQTNPEPDTNGCVN